MSVKSLIKMIDNPNIANDLDKQELYEIGKDVLRRAQEDLESMKDWIDCIDEGLKLCKPEFVGKSEPWDNSANYKSTLLTEASNNFGNRASIEIMRDMALVKAEIIGIQTLTNVIDKKSGEVSEMQEALDGINQQVQQMQEAQQPVDPQMQQQIEEIQQEIAKSTASIKEKKAAIKDKTQRADRVTEMMNWQVNHNMKEWRRDMKRMLYSIPNTGTTFKKTYRDESRGRCVSDIIYYPNFIVNQATVDQESCRSFTHIIAVDKNNIVQREKQGTWRKLELYTKEDSGDKLGNEANGVENASKNDDCFYEQYCWIDLDDDGYEEPYIVTVHKASGQVVRIVARYDFDEIIVSYKDMKPMPLLEAQRARAAQVMKDNEEFGTKNEPPDAFDLTGFRIVRIEPCAIITKYGFIPSYDGTYLDVGFFHLIGSTTMGVNKTSNDLLNSGTLANSQSGITAKGFRKRQGDFKFKMGQMMSTEIPVDQLQNSMYMFQFKEPSMTLFQLNESMKASAGSFVANVDVGGQIQANTAPTTALAMIQESMVQHTAHISMIIDSMGDEFEILYDLNSDYMDDEEYRKIVGDDEATFKDDFDTDGLSVVCGANPEMSSRMQRMMLADAELAQVPLVMQAGGNPIPIIKNYYKAIGSQNLTDYFPNEAEMSPQDRQQMQAMKQSQDQANQLQAQQNKLQELQVQLLSRAEDRKDATFNHVDKPKADAEVEKSKASTELTEAQQLLTLEQAQTEQTKNHLNIYTAHADILNAGEDLRLRDEKQQNDLAIAQQPQE